MIKVKICGVKDQTILEAALKNDADYIGFMFYDKSVRFIDLDKACHLRNKIKGASKAVAVVVDADDELIKLIVKKVKPDLIQAHGKESPQRIKNLKQTLGLPIIKAVNVESESDIKKANLYDIADFIMFDSKTSGSGKAFNWSWLNSNQLPQNWILAGGLNIANLAEAIAISGASFVDVSSGVEASYGNKDPKLVEEFLIKAKVL